MIQKLLIDTTNQNSVLVWCQDDEPEANQM